MTFFTPGPTQLYPTVEKHLQNALTENIGSISHRSKQFQNIYAQAVANLREIFNLPQDYQVIFGGSATQFMERTIQNCVAEQSFHFVIGSFSRRFYEISRDLGKFPRQLKVELGQPVQLTDLKMLQEAELVCFTHCETSSGVITPDEDIYRVRQEYPDKLIAVDAVSSVPSCALDLSQIDSFLFSVQKGFGLPAGLGVWIVSPRAIEKAEQLLSRGLSVGSYNALPLAVTKSKEYQTLETPNVLAIYLLAKITQDMLTYGIDKIRQQTQQKADWIYDFFDQHPTIKPYVANKKYRSQTVTVLECPEPGNILERFKELGYVLGGGYGEHKHKQFRIANFPSQSPQDTQQVLEIFKREF
jgi:phosphoserine aminotransferase